MEEFKFTCQGCGLAFQQAEDQRNHYKSDLHRYNMKRRVAGLPPISTQQFNQKFMDNVKSNDGNNVSQTIESKPSHVKQKNFEKVKNAKQSSSQRTQQLEPVDQEKLMEERLKSPNRLTKFDSLFDNHKSNTIEDNVKYMESKFSFFIPEKEYLVDLDGLLQYLADKVSVGHACLACNKVFTSLESIRKHMLDKSHNRIAYDTKIQKLEISDYYNFESSYPDSSKRNLKKEKEEDEWEEDEDIQSGEEDEMVVDDDNEDDEIEEGEDIRYGDTPYELVLPSGRRIGHRSMALYYKQRHLAPLNNEHNHGHKSITHRLATSDALIPAKGSGFGAFGEGQEVIKARNRGEAKLAKKATRQAKDVQKREHFKTKVGYKHNHQKHYRDQLLQ